MKKIAAILILAAAWYFAGMFSQTPLMTVVIGLAISAVVLMILSWYLTRHTEVTIPKQEDIAFKNIERVYRFETENTSNFPVNKFKVFFSMKYPFDKAVKKKFCGSAMGKRHNDANVSEFYFTAPYCGLIRVSLRKVRVYDYLSIFSGSKKLNQQREILVMPTAKNMLIELPILGMYDEDPIADTSSNKKGDDHSEIRNLREYREGDLFRHIHFNYSARTGELWVKEYQKENDYIFDMVLDTSGDEPPSMDYMDAFYEIIFSIIMTLIKHEVMLEVHWYDSEYMGIKDMTVTNEEEARDLLSRLYHSEVICTKDTFYNEIGNLDKKSMIINTKLEWYFMNRAVFRFHRETLEAELSDEFFRLGR